MNKYFILLLGILIGFGASRILRKSGSPSEILSTSEKIPTSALKSNLQQPNGVQQSCDTLLAQARYTLIYQALKIDDQALIRGANGISFEDPRMFLEMMDGFKKGHLCIDYTRNGAVEKSCIERTITSLEPDNINANSKKLIRESVILEPIFNSHSIATQETSEDSLLSEMLAKKRLVPVRDSKTGDISGYTKIVK